MTNRWPEGCPPWNLFSRQDAALPTIYCFRAGDRIAFRPLSWPYCNNRLRGDGVPCCGGGLALASRGSAPSVGKWPATIRGSYFGTWFGCRFHAGRRGLPPRRRATGAGKTGRNSETWLESDAENDAEKVVSSTPPRRARPGRGDRIAIAETAAQLVRIGHRIRRLLGNSRGLLGQWRSDRARFDRRVSDLERAIVRRGGRRQDDC